MLKSRIVLSIIILTLILNSGIKVDAYNSKTVETSLGTVEYSIQGQGMPVLVAHGIFGGFDQALVTGNNLMGQGYKIIGVSRFGYLKSSLPDKSTPQNQAQTFKELLDHLHIEKVVVLAVSAGGAPALKFVLEYPERTKALIMVGSGSPSKKEIKGPTGPPAFILNDFIFKIALAKPFRGFMRSGLFGIEKETYDNASPLEKEQLMSMLDLLLPVKPRKAGIINDEKITNIDMNKNYNKYSLEKIKTPTLIIHAQNDPMASFEDAKTMSKRILGAKFVSYEKGGHVLFGHQKEIQETINSFLK